MKLNEADININKVIGKVSVVDAGVEYKAQCLNEECNSLQKLGSAAWKIATGKCSVPPRQSMWLPRVSTRNKFAPLQGLHEKIVSRKSPVLSAALRPVQVDPQLRISNRTVQLVSVPKQTTLSLVVLKSSSSSTMVLVSANNNLLALLCQPAIAAPVSPRWHSSL